MKNGIKISIPNPCSENWDEMKPNNCGRFCNVCEKTVIDFTKMDDAEFVAYFQDNKKESCGRFTERQLSLDIPFKSKPLLPFWKMSKYVAASMIMVAGIGVKAIAQNIVTVQKSLKTNEAKKTDLDSTNGPIIIRGKVVDERKEGLPGASVSIQSLNVSTMTDVDGNFELIIDDHNSKIVYYDLQFDYLGYRQKIVPINIFTHPDIILVQFNEEDTQYLAGAVTTIRATKWMRFKWWFKNNFL